MNPKMYALIGNWPESKNDCTTRSIPVAWTLELFDALKIRCPVKFVSSIDGNVQQSVDHWSGTLSGLTRRDIRRGLTQVDPEWWPSAAGFLKLCKQTTTKKNDYQQYYQQLRIEKLRTVKTPETLEQKMNRKERAQNGIEKMRLILSEIGSAK